jgi:predicted MFS family arabinose efflux permease
MSLIALPWFVFATTGSTMRTGITALCELVPVIVMSFLAGAVVARLGARRTRVVSDAVSGVAVLTIPALHGTSGIPFWLLLALVAVNGFCRGPAVTASLILLRRVREQAALSNERATGIYLAGVRLAAAIGAPLAGGLIALVGAPGVLVVDAATFVVSAVIVQLTVRPDTNCVDWDADTEGLNVLGGFKAIRADKALRLMVGMSVVLASLGAGWATVGAPVYGQRVLGSSTLLGLLFGAYGFGAVVGNLGFAWLARRWTTHRLLWTALLLTGVPVFVALAANQPVPVLLACMVCAGLGNGILGPLFINLQYDRIAAPMHGHVFGLTGGLEQCGTALGAFGAGLLLSVVSLPDALLAAAAVGLVLTVIAWFAPSLRTLDSTSARGAHSDAAVQP